MFWGLTLESGKRYAQKVETSFHVSMAALDLRSAGSDANESVSVMVTVDKNDYLLCNLSKHKFQQQHLDLNFETGDTIAFMTKGKGIVHLTGYLIPEDDFTNFPSEEEEASSEEENIDLPASIKKELMKQEKKRKNDHQLKPDAKKAKLANNVQEDSDVSDEDDEDFDEDAEEEAGSEEEEEENVLDEVGSGEEEEDDVEEESGGEEEEDDDESDSSSMEASPPQKFKQQQQQQNNKTANKTPNKTPVVNGNANQQQSGKKNKNKGETPKGQTPQGKQQQQQQQQKSPQTPKSPSEPQKKLAGGVVVEDLIQGNGPLAKPGRTASVYYVGRLKHNNKQFDATQSGSGFKFRLGRGEVIKGWDIGVQGMKVGGKRRITCPPGMAYGARGSPPTIPPNCPLVFEVELKAVS